MADRIEVRESNFASGEEATQETTEKLYGDAYPCQQISRQKASLAKESGFRGVDVGLIKIGIDKRSRSLDFGLNVGIAKVDAKLGQRSGIAVAAGAGPVVGNVGAKVEVGQEGLGAGFRAGIRATEHLRLDTSVGGNVGPTTGVEGDLKVKVGPIRTGHDASFSVGPHGFNNGYEGQIGLRNLASLRTGGHANLNHDSSAGADAEIRLGNMSIRSGVEVDTFYNSRLNPHLHARLRTAGTEDRAYVGMQVGPRADVEVGGASSHKNIRACSERDAELSFSVGESGIGFLAVESENGARHVRRLGIGPRFKSESSRD